MSAVAVARISQDCLGRFEVRVEVADNGETHRGENDKMVRSITKLKRQIFVRGAVGNSVLWRHIQFHFQFLEVPEQGGQAFLLAGIVKSSQLPVRVTFSPGRLGQLIYGEP